MTKLIIGVMMFLVMTSCHEEQVRKQVVNETER
jgi:hypothetical protein